MFEFDFRNWLISQTAVSNAVGNRVYPTQVPQDCASPAITMPATNKTIYQYQGGQTSTAVTTFDITIWCEGNEIEAYYAAKTLAKTLRSTLDIVSTTMGSTAVYSVSVVGEKDLTFTFYDGQSTGVQGVTVTAEVAHSEA